MTDRNVALAWEISRAAGFRATSISPVAGQGSVNHVYVAVWDGEPRAVVRFAVDPLRTNEFEAEEWCLGKARLAGPQLRAVLRRLHTLEPAFGLAHGDLAPRNLLFPYAGAPVLIDWGSASAGPIPYGDLLPVYEGHHASGEPSGAELTAFANGMGIDRSRIWLLDRGRYT
jgi:hypothetical protein